MMILGIDPGISSMGYGIVGCKNGRVVASHFGTVKTSSKMSFECRCLQLFDFIDNVWKEFCPSVMSIEDQYLGSFGTKKNFPSVLKLGMARGVISLVAAKNGASVYTYAPSEVKVSIVGNGRASKIQVKNMVKKLLKIEEDIGEDTADALAIALCHIFRHGNLSR